MKTAVVPLRNNTHDESQTRDEGNYHVSLVLLHPASCHSIDPRANDETPLLPTVCLQPYWSVCLSGSFAPSPPPPPPWPMRKHPEIAALPQHVLRLHDPDPVLFSSGRLSRCVQDQRGSLRPSHGTHRSQHARVQHHGAGENAAKFGTKHPSKQHTHKHTRGTSSSSL